MDLGKTVLGVVPSLRVPVDVALQIKVGFGRGEVVVEPGVLESAETGLLKVKWSPRWRRGSSRFGKQEGCFATDTLVPPIDRVKAQYCFCEGTGEAHPGIQRRSEATKAGSAGQSAEKGRRRSVQAWGKLEDHPDPAQRGFIEVVDAAEHFEANVVDIVERGYQLVNPVGGDFVDDVDPIDIVCFVLYNYFGASKYRTVIAACYNW